ncbi:MAG TPA: MEDS domain-containing protein, partial [Allocoleopsis sp.]
MTTTYQTEPQEVDMGFTPERFPLGLHMCYVFNNNDERHEVMSRFINRGLDVGEFVGYFADVDTPDLVEEYLADMGIRVPDTSQQSNTLFKRARDVYCPDNHFSPENMLRQLRTLHKTCHADCRHELRVTGEMSW